MFIWNFIKCFLFLECFFHYSCFKPSYAVQTVSQREIEHGQQLRPNTNNSCSIIIIICCGPGFSRHLTGLKYHQSWIKDLHVDPLLSLTTGHHSLCFSCLYTQKQTYLFENKVYSENTVISIVLFSNAYVEICFCFYFILVLTGHDNDVNSKNKSWCNVCSCMVLLFIERIL